MNILLLAWNRFRTRRPKGNIGHELFRRDLAKYHNVAFYGLGYFCNFSYDVTIHDLFEKYGKPDLVFVHSEHRERKFPAGIFDELGKLDILKVHYCGDYVGRAWDAYDDHFRKIQYDIIFVPVSQFLVILKEHGIGGEHFLLPFSVDTSVFYDRRLEKVLDVAVPISPTARSRKRLKKFVDQLDVKTSTSKISFDGYIQRINESKIIVTHKKYKFLSLKWTEVLACGTLMMGNKPEDFDRVGFKDGEHAIIYDGFKDLEEKIDYFLKHDREREAIAKNGMEFVRKYHSNKVRVAELTEMIQTRKQIDWIERIGRNFTPIFPIHR